MKKGKTGAGDKYKELRARAEAKLKKRFDKIQKESAGDPEKVLHELQVHQIELEMQNEELRKAQQELEESRNKYSDLYDFAPVGYFTFDKNGVIIEANLAGCGMLGVERVNLIKKSFHSFVAKDSQDVFYLHRQHVTKTAARQTCEITVIRKNKEKFEAQLESIPAESADGKIYYCRSAITDITRRKQAEEDIKMLARFPSENPSPILRLSADGKILYSNKPGMVVLESWNRIIGEKSPERWRKLIKDALGSKKPLIEDIDIQGRTYAFMFAPIAEGGYVNVYGRDITERKQLERLKEAIKEQAITERNRLEAVMEALPVGVALLDAKGGRIQNNEAFEKVWGSPLPEAHSIKDYAQYKAWWADTGKPVKPREWACIQAVLEGRTVTGQILEIQRFDGPRAFVLNGASPVRDANDKIIGSAVAIQDITAMRKAEEAIRKSEEKFSALYSTMTEGVALHEIVFDKSGKAVDYMIMDVNPAYEYITGLSMDKVIGKSAKDVYDVKLPPFIDIYSKVASSGKPESFETWFEPMKKHFSISVFSQGTEKFATVFEDITERKQAEDELRKLASVVEHTNEFIGLADLDGKIIFINQAGAKMLGMTNEEIEKAYILQVIPDNFKDKVQNETLPILKEKGHWEGDLQYKNLKTGKITDVYATTFTINDPDTGKPLYLANTSLDITERKQAEEQLRQFTEELKRSNRDLEQYAYVVSHDLREPLRAISGFVNLLEERYKEKLDEKAIGYIKFATDGVKRMDDLLTGLLAYSRIQTQGKPKAAIPARGALREAIAKLQKRIDESGAAITYDELPEIRADGLQIIQLFQHLLDNAIKFRSENKPEIHVGWQKQDNGFQFFVRDNGIGIDPQFHERIFLMFQRLHTREKYPGYGTGLTICRRIVERHGGKMWVESEAGKGATFFFTIPA